MLNRAWDILIFKFRKLVVIANNICQKDGIKGRVIFPVNEGIKPKTLLPEI